MNSIAYTNAIARILMAYQDKTEEWAKYQLDLALRNTDIDLDTCTDEEATQALGEVLYWIFGLNGKRLA